MDLNIQQFSSSSPLQIKTATKILDPCKHKRKACRKNGGVRRRSKPNIKKSRRSAQDNTRLHCGSSHEEPNKDFEISGHAEITCDVVGFVDEEAMFNMPVLLDSMAEGMLLTPLAMKKGFNWDQYDRFDHHHLLDFNLWSN